MTSPWHYNLMDKKLVLLTFSCVFHSCHEDSWTVDYRIINRMFCKLFEYEFENNVRRMGWFERITCGNLENRESLGVICQGLWFWERCDIILVSYSWVYMSAQKWNPTSMDSYTRQQWIFIDWFLYINSIKKFILVIMNRNNTSYRKCELLP